jgi:flagellar L-ring protein precursor FlgH
MRRLPLAFVPLTLVLVLPGCVQMPPRPDDPAHAPTYVPTTTAAPAYTGSLYSAAASRPLFDDRRAVRVGDVITVLLDDRFRSSKQTGSTITKTNSAEIQQPTVLGSVLQQVATTAGLVTGLTSSSDFEGSAEGDQSNSISGTLSVTVTEVLPNGLMQVRGEKWLTLNQGDEFVRVSGLVRPEDVSPDNTVSSRRIANARIAYSGTGAFADSSSMGWLSRFFLSPVFPW